MSRLSFARRLARGNRGALPAVPPPVPVDGPVGLRFETPAPPRLIVRKGSGGWAWWVVHPGARRVGASNFDRGFHAWHPTHAEALAVGLAALETATLTHRTG